MDIYGTSGVNVALYKENPSLTLEFMTKETLEKINSIREYYALPLLPTHASITDECAIYLAIRCNEVTFDWKSLVDKYCRGYLGIVHDFMEIVNTKEPDVGHARFRRTGHSIATPR